MARTPQIQRLSLRNNATGQGLLLTTLAMLALGVVMVHSAVASVVNPGAWYARVDVRHTVFAALALLVLATAWMFKYQWLQAGKRFPVIPALALLISLVAAGLVFVPGVGHSVGGYHRWIRLGPAQYAVGFQPSELIKLSLIVFLAAWLTRPNVTGRSVVLLLLPILVVGGVAVLVAVWIKCSTTIFVAGCLGLVALLAVAVAVAPWLWKKTYTSRSAVVFVVAMLLIGGCTGIVVTQDFGTGVLIVTSATVTLLLAGVPWYYLLSLIPPGAAAVYVLLIKNDYRFIRILAWLDPWSQTNPSAYQPRQSLLAIVSGGWYGRGPGNGLQKLGYLPEDNTDFIFAAFCEEWGFVGAMLLMGLVLLWIWHARRAAIRAGDRFGRVLAGGLGFVVAMQMVLHIAVDTVTTPPTGICLPFVSAGGTALVILAGAVALIISVTAHRRTASSEIFGELEVPPEAAAKTA